MNNDLISRSALLEQVRFSLPIDSERRRVIADCVEITRRLITEAPAVDAEADLVPVVRCRDCVYWRKAKTNSKGFLICPASRMEIMATDFCSYGGRRANHD